MQVSILITSFNQIDFLKQAIDSALNQTTQPFEVVICDDCSEDGSQKLITQYERQHPALVRAFLHPKNLGIPRNKNFAIQQAKGEWIIGLDGDDWLEPTKIAATQERLELDSGARVIFGNFDYVDQHGERIARWIDPGYPPPPTGSILAEIFTKSYPQNNLFRNEAIHLPSLREIGGYDVEMDIYEDWELRVRLSHKLKFAYCDEVLSHYRCHEGGISRIHPETHIRYIRRILEKNRKLLDEFEPGEREKLLKKYVRLQRPFTGRIIKRHLNSFSIGNARDVWKEHRIYKKHVLSSGNMFAGG